MYTTIKQNKVILLGIFFILVCVVTIIFVLTGLRPNHTATTPPIPAEVTNQKPSEATLFDDASSLTAPQDAAYVSEDRAIAPQRAISALRGTLSRKTTVSGGHTWQQFVINNTTDTIDRVLLNHTADKTTFEPITNANWSPNNRFVFIFFKTPEKRDVLFLMTDGRFTNTQYYLHPTDQLHNETVTNAFWQNEDIAIVETVNQTTNQKKRYAINFDDSVGSIVESK
jgi:hypothetical protein